MGLQAMLALFCKLLLGSASQQHLVCVVQFWNRNSGTSLDNLWNKIQSAAAADLKLSKQHQGVPPILLIYQPLQKSALVHVQASHLLRA